MSLQNYLKRFLQLVLSFIALITKPIYGGQAVIGGVMMKGLKSYSISVNTRKGIKTKLIPFKSYTQRYKLFSLPFIRGVVILVEMMVVGYKTINYSAEVAIGNEEEQKDDEEQQKKEDALTNKKSSNKNSSKKSLTTTTSKKSSDSELSSWMLVLTLVFSLVLAIFLFKFLPLGIVTLLGKIITLKTVVFNLLDGIIKASIFVLYIFLIGQYKDVKELFRYHGAEHKTINCFESGKPLTIKNISSFSTVHLRCGTTFIFVVLFISILVYLFIPRTLPFFVNLAFRLALLPLIASIAYEIQRFNATHKSRFFSFLLQPGLWLQSLTTNLPAPKHNRAAKAALLAVVEDDNKK